MPSPPEDRPPVEASFLFFHGMVGVGFTMIAIAALGFLYFRHGSLHERRWLLWILVFSVLGPQIANQLGWFAAEVGRQPWIVYGLMRTPAGLSAVVKANVVLTSLILFTFIYFLLFAVFIYLLNDKIQHGPDDAGFDSVRQTGVADKTNDTNERIGRRELRIRMTQT